MSDLDKYFEKARNVEPIYEEEDTRKFLAGKLSDGGIATNLYNKIKVYPMLTALITSVATIATIALLSISSSDSISEKATMPNYTSSSTSAWQTGTENAESLKSDDVIKEEAKAVSTIATNDIVEKESTEKKKQDGTGTVTWADDNTIDVKAVNSLKLTKDELAKLGIELDQKSFKVNAFDKYTYTIFQNNEKTRDYYSKDEDQDAMPTPAMITTKTGFKTLTLFKKGNIEAIVDRVKSVDGESEELRSQTVINEINYLNNSRISKKFKDAPKFDMYTQKYDDYKKSLIGNKDSAEILKELEKIKSLDFTMNGQTMPIDFQKLIGNGDFNNKVFQTLELSEFLNMNPNDLKSPKNENNIELSIRYSDTEEPTKVKSINVAKTKINTNLRDLLLRESDITDLEWNKRFGNTPQYNMNNGSFEMYKKSLSGNIDSAEIINLMESYETMEIVVDGKTTTVDVSGLLKNANQNDKELMRKIFRNSFVSDNYSNYSVRDFSVNLKKKGTNEFDRLSNLNVGNSNKLDSINKFKTHPLLDSAFLAKSKAFEDQMKNYILRSKYKDLNTKDMPDDVLRAMDSILKKNNIDVAPELQFQLDKSVQMRDLLLRDSDNFSVDMLNSKDSMIEGTVIWVDELKQDDLIVKPFKKNLLQRESDSLNVISISPVSNKKDIKVITEKYEIQDDKKVYDDNENDSSAQKKLYEIKIDGRVFSIPFEELLKDGQLDQNKYKEFIMSISKAIGKDLNVDSQFSGGSSNKIENYELNIKTELEENEHIVPMGKLIIEDGETEHKFELKPGQSIWADENQDGVNKSWSSNMSLDFINYNINELIPIEVSFDGVNTDFIVWYEANEDFLTKLPQSLLEKINPELAAISEQTQNCENAPIKKDDAVMDVWSGCSGAIKEMRVFPNPANSESKVEFELEDNRQVSIAVYDLSGKLIKKIKNSDSYSKGWITESLNLNGVNPGLYYVVVKSEIGEQALQRIIIE